MERKQAFPKKLAVVHSAKEVGLLGRKLLPKNGVNNLTTKHLPVVKGYKAHMMLIPGSQPMFCNARKIPLPLQEKATEKLEQMVKRDSLEPVQPGGVNKATPMRKVEVLCGLSLLKVAINGKVMDEDYPIPDMEKIHNLHEAS